MSMMGNGVQDKVHVVCMCMSQEADRDTTILRQIFIGFRERS